MYKVKMSKLIFVALSLAGLCATALLFTAFIPTDSTSSTVPTLQSLVILPDGAKRATFSNGAVFVGTPGTNITFKQTAQGFAMGTTPPDPGTGSGDSAMANAYWAQGRSPAKDTIDAGGRPALGLRMLSVKLRKAWLSQTLIRRVAATSTRAQMKTMAVATASCQAGSLWDSGVAIISDSHTTMKGAYRRYTTCDSDPNYHYTYEDSQMSGQGHNPCFLGCADNTMGTEHTYGHGTIIRWEPQSDLTPSGSSCQTQTLSMGAYGVSVANSVLVCPEKIHPNVPYRDFTVQWMGCTR